MQRTLQLALLLALLLRLLLRYLVCEEVYSFISFVRSMFTVWTLHYIKWYIKQNTIYFRNKGKKMRDKTVIIERSNV